MTRRTPSRRNRTTAAAAAGALAVAGVLVAGSPAAAAPGTGAGCDNRNNNTVAKLLECVTVEGVDRHLTALQQIAEANGGNRASGLPGYAASAGYVEQQLRAAGYQVTQQSFDFPFFQLDASSLARLGEAPATYEQGVDYAPMTYSGSAAVEGTAVPVDVDSATSGCEAGDFPADVAGQVALVTRGTCSFQVKAENAEVAGAAGVVIVNDGTTPEREGLLNGTLGGPGVGIPVVGTTAALGAELAGAPVALEVQAVSEFRQTTNVLAELPGRTSDDVVMVGAHLDSVPEAPGISDNGTGSAAVLEVALRMAKTKPTNTVRFAWWGAEELGLLGSEHYVTSLDDQQRARIAAYLNFDMVGSPNHVQFVYDGDQSTFPSPLASDGSAAIEDVFRGYFAERGLPIEDTAFDGRSDYLAFAEAGIASGGLFTGADGVKTPEEQALYGGVVGEPYDPCYHRPCDDLGNVDREVLEVNADAIAYATLTLAFSTETVNGAPGRPVPGSRAAAGGGAATAPGHAGDRAA